MGETRVTIQEAARLLGVSEGAVRKRVKRDSIRHDKDEAGRIFVYLDGGARGVDEGLDEVPHPDSSVLISEMRARIDSLELQLEQANQRDRENRRIIAALTQRIPEIEAPRAAPQERSEMEDALRVRHGEREEPFTTREESPQEPVADRSNAADEQQGRGPIPEAGSPQEPAQRRGFWARLFGTPGE